MSKITLRALFVGAWLILGAATASSAFAWGQKGHDVTCNIAQRHLTKKAQKAISEIFDGKSIVYWSNWMDNASHGAEFAYTKTWHYKNIDAGESFDEAPLNENGDVVTAIEAQVAALKSGTLNKEASALALKMLVHLVGDLHCPMHMGHRSDSGGNRWQVQYFNNGSNLHSVWDSSIVESAHKWTYTEWANELDVLGKGPAVFGRGNKDIQAITAGSLRDWGKETFAIATYVYDNTPVGSKLSYDEVAFWTPVIEQQFLYGGLRLAALLNDIFQ